MRIKIFSVLLSLIFAFSVKIPAQNLCESSYMPFKEGVKFELTHYDKKGKATGISKHEVKDLEEIDGGFKATVKIENTDEKGKELHEGEYTMECKDGVIYMDMSSLLNTGAMAGVSGMEMEMSGSALEIPNRLEPGQTLPDGNLVMKTKSGGMTLFTMTMDVKNRKVESSEPITTPAGTFDCIKITQDTEMNMLGKKKFKSATWYAKGVGMVKTENYDSKGNVESSSVLTKLER